MKKITLLFLFTLFTQITAPKYVSLSGSDTNSGSIDSPFKTITKQSRLLRREILYKWKAEFIIIQFQFLNRKGFEIRKAGYNAIGITGSFNIVGNCAFYENRNTELQLDNGVSNNRFISCDSYYHFYYYNKKADTNRFALKLTMGSGNYF